MSGLTRTTVLNVVLGTTVSPALGCFMMAPMDLRDILTADVVIDGTVTRYSLVVTEYDRRYRERLLALMKDQQREEFEKQPPVSYALLDIWVARSLVGSVSGQITVTWRNSTFQLPKDIDARLRTFALRDPRKRAPTLPLRSGSGVVWPVPELDKLTVLQAPCAMPFMFEANEPTGRAIREIFDGVGDPEAKADALANSFGMTGNR
ncbi:hypothetical protein G3T14_14810 [Methylobacterium sp. BTF04]|uniref:hypothetical protein n=1 Tax=Methylobacterium sp. BTF04 TaxID=2708300 RepID=UPI0013D1539E|nr:hypothetical protein [Methylobacterium sp. BTF04]NEU13392.1 hypothetical protein [Methylobacterium sp. BTF04]